MRKLLPLILMVSLVLVAIGCAKPAAPSAAPSPSPKPTPAASPALKTYAWKLGQRYPSGSFIANMAEDLIKRVSEASNGRIKITHYPGDLLGDYMVQNESVSLGKQEMTITAAVAANNPKWDAKLLPFMMYSLGQAYDFVKPGGWLYAVFQDISKECNWRLVGTATDGMPGVITNAKFEPVPGGPPKGMKTRISASPVKRMLVEAYGMQAIEMPWSDIGSALMLKTIDAAEGFCNSADYSQFIGSYKYAYMYNGAFISMQFIMNLPLFNSLSKEDQAMLEKVGAEWTQSAWSAWEKEQDNKFKDIRKQVTVIDLTPEQWAANAKAARATTWPYLEKLLGKEVMDKVRAGAVQLPISGKGWTPGL